MLIGASLEAAHVTFPTNREAVPADVARGGVVVLLSLLKLHKRDRYLVHVRDLAKLRMTHFHVHTPYNSSL
jgi:hypothetical protein